MRSRGRIQYRAWVYTNNCCKKSNFVGKYMVRSEYKQHTDISVWGIGFYTAGREGKGREGHTCRMLVAGEDLAEGGGARPVVAAGKERPRERRRGAEKEKDTNDTVPEGCLFIFYR